MITKLLLKFLRWWDYDFPILQRTEKGHWVGIVDFKDGHKLVPDEHFPGIKTAKVVQYDYVTLRTPLDGCVTVKFEGSFK